MLLPMFCGGCGVERSIPTSCAFTACLRCGSVFVTSVKPAFAPLVAHRIVPPAPVIPPITTNTA